MTPNDRLRMAQALLDENENLRMKRVRLLAQLAQGEKRQSAIETEFRRAFPDLDFDVPVARWEELTASEQVVLHFLAKRGHVRRVLDVLPVFREWAGTDISEIGFRMHLSRLRAKRAVVVGYVGWAVAPALLEKALNPPVVPKMPARTGMEGIRRKAKAIPKGEGPQGAKPLDLAALLPEPDPTPGDVYSHIPVDAPVSLAALTLATEGVMSGPGLARTRKSVEALMEQLLVVKVSRETYARRGVAEEEGPTPALDRVYRHVPRGEGIGIGALAVLVEGTTDIAARRRVMMRLKRLMKAGWVRRTGRGFYARQDRAAKVNIPALSPAAVAFLARLDPTGAGEPAR